MVEFIGGVLLTVLCVPAVFGFMLGWTVGSRRGKEQVAAALTAIEDAKMVLAKYKDEANAKLAEYHEETLADLLNDSPGRDIHLKGN